MLPKLVKYKFKIAIAILMTSNQNCHNFTQINTFAVNKFDAVGEIFLNNIRKNTNFIYRQLLIYLLIANPLN